MAGPPLARPAACVLMHGVCGTQDCGDGRTAQVIDQYEDRLVHLQAGPHHQTHTVTLGG
jgi:hypothetical protein